MCVLSTPSFGLGHQTIGPNWVDLKLDLVYLIKKKAKGEQETRPTYDREWAQSIDKILHTKLVVMRQAQAF